MMNVLTLAITVTGSLLSISALAVDLNSMDASASRFSNLKTIHIAYKGDIIWAKAYNGTKIHAVANIKSASKSLMSGLIGIALDKNIIKSEEQSVTELLELPPSVKNNKQLQQIKLKHLLSMQSGLMSTSGKNYGAWVASSNWVNTALTRPFIEEVGGNMVYSTGNTHLLSAIIMQQTGKNTYKLANQWLQGSGVRIESWETDPQGIPMGGNQLGMTPASLLAFGELYRRGGVTKSGKRILSEHWIKKSWQAKTQSQFHEGLYGYGWFIQKFAGYQGYYGWGYGGQMIYVIPELELTVAITSQEYLPSGRSGYRDALHNLLSTEIIPSIESAS
ncbi:serine hydrolase domain-containing protein [Marinomonas epiphytica]